MASGPLDGIRVLEFSQIIAGPFAGLNLADMGAEVIKVEPPEGEPWRIFGAPALEAGGKWFHSLNRGKKSLVLKLQDERAQKIIHDLVPDIDVVIVNYRPDVPARLGIDYETLSAIRPDLIYVDNTAFGRKGPWSHRPGYDIVVQAATGLMAGEGKVTEDGAPERMVANLADYSTGIAMAWGVCAALFHRERTGEGQLVGSTLLATALAVQGNEVTELPAVDAMMRGPTKERVRQLREEGASYAELLAARNPFAGAARANIYYRAFKTKNGALAIGALSDSLRTKVRTALELDVGDISQLDLMDPETQKILAKLAEEVPALLESRTTEEWIEIFDREGVPAAPVNFAEDMSTDPQVLANEMVVELEHELTGPETQVAPILTFAKSPLEAQGSSPPLGRDTDGIVGGAGYSAEQLADLRADGVIA